MSKVVRSWSWWIGSLGLVSAAACADVGGAAEPTRLDQVIVPDESFDFATARAVRLDLVLEPGAAPQALEVLDTESRRLLDGAFKASASVDLRLPAGRDQALQVRVGQGAAATTRVVAVDAAGRATTEL